MTDGQGTYRAKMGADSSIENTLKYPNIYSADLANWPKSLGYRKERLYLVSLVLMHTHHVKHKTFGTTLLRT